MVSVLHFELRNPISSTEGGRKKNKEIVNIRSHQSTAELTVN